MEMVVDKTAQPTREISAKVAGWSVPNSSRQSLCERQKDQSEHDETNSDLKPHEHGDKVGA